MTHSLVSLKNKIHIPRRSIISIISNLWFYHTKSRRDYLCVKEKTAQLTMSGIFIRNNLKDEACLVIEYVGNFEVTLRKSEDKIKIWWIRSLNKPSLYIRSGVSIKVKYTWRLELAISTWKWAPAWENQQFGFWPGLTQARLYSNLRWLEAWNFLFRKKRYCTIQVAKTKALISFAVTALCFRICKSLVFSRRGSNDSKGPANA